ncbi:MAG: DUF1588 domain-containing protein, partial [Planctomycetota bacterium]
AQIADYVRLANKAVEDGKNLRFALRLGYRSLLCSPRFLYFHEAPGKLDNHAVADRMSYMLTGGPPDKRLARLADVGELNDPAKRRAEAERLLQGEGGRRFVKEFAGEWLELDQLPLSQPERKLFPGYDTIVQYSMLEETHAYLATMLHDDLSVVRLIDSDFTFLNSRLSRHYGVEAVEGDAMQRVALEPQNRRGGVLTQGAILQVTANGTNTSPVVRGVWVGERLLGRRIPPPPDGVPAIEPDIHGAVTIREQLAKHRSDSSCAACHAKIDPVGFALENYDAVGKWRQRYTTLVGGRRKRGAVIDSSDEMPNGKTFRGVDEFRKLVISEPRQIAANVAEQLLAYGTGAQMSFADRGAVEQILDATEASGFGFRSILLEVVNSQPFLTK